MKHFLLTVVISLLAQSMPAHAFEVQLGNRTLGEVIAKYCSTNRILEASGIKDPAKMQPTDVVKFPFFTPEEMRTERERGDELERKLRSAVAARAEVDANLERRGSELAQTRAEIAQLEPIAAGREFYRRLSVVLSVCFFLASAIAALYFRISRCSDRELVVLRQTIQELDRRDRTTIQIAQLLRNVSSEAIERIEAIIHSYHAIRPAETQSKVLGEVRKVVQLAAVRRNGK